MGLNEQRMKGSTGKENRISTWSQRQELKKHTGRDETVDIREKE